MWGQPIDQERLKAISIIYGVDHLHERTSPVRCRGAIAIAQFEREGASICWRVTREPVDITQISLGRMQHLRSVAASRPISSFIEMRRHPVLRCFGKLGSLHSPARNFRMRSIGESMKRGKQKSLSRLKVTTKAAALIGRWPSAQRRDGPAPRFSTLTQVLLAHYQVPAINRTAQRLPGNRRPLRGPAFPI